MLPIVEVQQDAGSYYVHKGDRGTWVHVVINHAGHTMVVMARADGEIRTLPGALVKVVGWRTANIGL